MNLFDLMEMFSIGRLLVKGPRMGTWRGQSKSIPKDLVCLNNLKLYSRIPLNILRRKTSNMVDKDFEAKVSVTCKANDRGGIDIEIGHTENIQIENAAMIMASAISLVVKSVNLKDGIRDYELIEQVINYLNDEFASTTSFQDAKLIYKKQNYEEN
jgi:hypothetical protein